MTTAVLPPSTIPRWLLALLVVWGASIQTIESFSPPSPSLIHSNSRTIPIINSRTRCSSTTTRRRELDAQFEEDSLTSSETAGSTNPTTVFHHTDRRKFFAVSTLLTIATTTSSIPAHATAAAAVTEESNQSTSATSQKISTILRAIPTFTIVDPRGVPYMVVGDDAKLTSYFFTTFEEASRILQLASTSADRTLRDMGKEIDSKRKSEGKKVLVGKEREVEVGGNPWKDARISTVPLDFAVTLASRGQMGGSYFRVAPAEADVQDALTIDTTKTKLKDGKVPLFYIEDFETKTKQSGVGGEAARIPLYFKKRQLLQDWKTENPEKGDSRDGAPEVRVTELFSVLQKMAESGAIENDGDIGKLVLVSPVGSAAKATACGNKGGSEAPFVLGERIVVL